jgi:hypothetical protein
MTNNSPATCLNIRTIRLRFDQPYDRDRQRLHQLASALQRGNDAQDHIVTLIDQ